ncbi:hypothetical protein KDM41_03875 [bacterium]|nr:hypothetical protein [bacterium]
MITSRARTGALFLLALGLLCHPVFAPASPVNEGGDDVLVVADAGGNLLENHLFVTDAGAFYNVFRAGYDVLIMLSTDRGATWSEWGRAPRTAGENLFLHGAALTEGMNPRLHLLYAVESDNALTDGTIRHAWTPYTGGPPNWSESVPFAETGVSYWGGDLAVDAADYDDYRVYAVAVRYDGVHWAGLQYARSTDQGDTWEPSFSLADGQDGDFFVRRPHLAWGAGRLHVTWSWGDDSLGEGFTANGVRYRHATGFGAGPGDFAPMQDLLPADVGPENNPLDIVASSATGDVYLLYATVGFSSGGEVWRSRDGGSTWDPADVGTFDADDAMAHLALNDAGDRLYVSGVHRDAVGEGCRGQPVVQRGVVAGAAGPDFGAPMVFAADNTDQGIWETVVGIDSADSDAFGVAWAANASVCEPPAAWPMRFDATWRNDPGFPVTEAGFPVPLAEAPAGPLTAVQLDYRPQLELTWLDDAGYLHVTTHTGAPILGTPLWVGNPVDGNAVAVGDLDGDGVPALVVGDADGQVHAFSAATGALLPGFPVDLGTAAARVAVGAVATGAPRSIVATCGTGVHIIGADGQIEQSWTTSANISQPPAIGDLDFDGQNEIVVVESLRLVRIDPGDPVRTWSVLTGFTGITTPPTLTDLHVDGTIEASRQIVFGTAAGTVRAYRADGTSLWTFDSGVAHDVSAIASTFIRGAGAPGLQFAIDGGIYNLREDGTLWGGFPHPTGTGGRIAPVVGTVEGFSSDIVYGNVFGGAWCVDNFGNELDGWPLTFDDPILYSPVIADIDADGRNEIIVQTAGEMRAMDTNAERQSTARVHWGQWGFDAGHTFCLSNTDTPVVSPVPDDVRPTRIAFAPPHPNPSSGASRFQFVLPDAADVSLKVYDVRGRLVKAVAVGRFEPGGHVLAFDGRGPDGRTLADGIYFARLTVRDGTGRHDETRKLVILR